MLRLWVFLGAVDFKQGKDIVRVRKIFWLLYGSPGRGLDWTQAGALNWGLGL